MLPIGACSGAALLIDSCWSRDCSDSIDKCSEVVYNSLHTYGSNVFTECIYHLSVYFD